MYLTASSRNLQHRKPYDHHHRFSQNNHIISELVTPSFATKSLPGHKYHSPASFFQPWRGHENWPISSAFYSKGINFSVIAKFHHIEYSQHQAASSWVSNSSYYRRNFHHKDIHGNGIWPLVKLNQMGSSLLGQFQTLHAGQGTQMA